MKGPNKRLNDNHIPSFLKGPFHFYCSVGALFHSVQTNTITSLQQKITFFSSRRVGESHPELKDKT